MEKGRLPNPHLGQMRVLHRLRRFSYLSAGRRWRKTTTGVILAHTGFAYGRGVADKATILWGAPTFDQCRIAWGEVQKAAPMALFQQSRMEVIYPNGGRIIFRSLDKPDNARGHTVDGVIIDEAGYVDERAWYDVIRPMLSDTNGWAFIMGTPRGRNWFYREHVGAQGDSISFQAPTLGVRVTSHGLERKPHELENPTFPFGEAVKLQKMLPQRVFEQEFLAEFVEQSGSVFRRVREAATEQAQEPVPGRTYVFGIDWGRDNDYTAITVWDGPHMVALDRFSQIDYAIQVGRLRALVDRWHPDNIVAEANSMGQPIIDMLAHDGLPITPFQTTNASKAQIIDGLALALERGEVTLQDDPVLVGEMQAYEMESLPSGLIRYSAPDGMHDDTVMATAIGFWGVSDTGPLLLWGDK